jgi:diguanylate cyclase (GGDEF)-like protein
MSLLLIDIDHFKAFNDTYGHLAGDDCIRQVAETIQNCTNRAGDIVARYGGEEFVVLLTNTPESGARHVAEQMRLAVMNRAIAHRESSASEYVTVSIGGATLSNTQSTDFTHLLHAADQHLYRSKEGGRNQVTVRQFTPQPKLLLLDQNNSTHPILEQLSSHCTVIRTQSYADAISHLQQQAPDIVMLDDDNIDDALHFCQQLESLDALRVPIILVTAHERARELAKQVQWVVLSKPVDSRQLLANINRFLI